MALISLSYVSAASRPMTEDDLEDILKSSRENNAKDNITGMLLYRNGYFIQALEGEEDKVMRLYNKIAQDDRHQNVLTVQKEEIENRSFGDWSMGFRNLEEKHAEDLEGYTDFLDSPFDEEKIEGDNSRAVALLELFKEGGQY